MYFKGCTEVGKGVSLGQINMITLDNTSCKYISLKSLTGTTRVTQWFILICLLFHSHYVMKYEWGLLVVVMLQLRIIPVRVLQPLSMNPLPSSQLCSTCSSRSAYSAYLDFFSLHPFLCIWEISKNNRPGGKRETIVRRGEGSQTNKHGPGIIVPAWD